LTKDNQLSRYQKEASIEELKKRKGI